MTRSGCDKGDFAFAARFGTIGPSGEGTANPFKAGAAILQNLHLCAIESCA